MARASASGASAAGSRPVVLDAGQALLLRLVELSLRERRLAQHLDREPHGRHEVGFGRANGRRGAAPRRR